MIDMAMIAVGANGGKVRAGQRVESANGNLGTLVGRVDPSGFIVAIRLDNGRQVSCAADLVTPIFEG